MNSCSFFFQERQKRRDNIIALMVNSPKEFRPPLREEDKKGHMCRAEGKEKVNEGDGSCFGWEEGLVSAHAMT